MLSATAQVPGPFLVNHHGSRLRENVSLLLLLLVLVLLCEGGGLGPSNVQHSWFLRNHPKRVVRVIHLDVIPRFNRCDSPKPGPMPRLLGKVADHLSSYKYVQNALYNETVTRPSFQEELSLPLARPLFRFPSAVFQSFLFLIKDLVSFLFIHSLAIPKTISSK